MLRPASARCPRFLLHIRHCVADHAPDCARDPAAFGRRRGGLRWTGAPNPPRRDRPVRLSPRRLFRCRQTCTGGSRGRRPPEHDNKLSPALDMIRKEGCILADAGKQRRLAFRKPRQANEVKPRDLGDPALVDGPSGLPGAPAVEKTGNRTQPKSYRKPLAQMTEVIPAALRSSSRMGAGDLLRIRRSPRVPSSLGASSPC